MKKTVSLVAFILVVVLIGLAIGYTNSPTDWYGALNKPAFTPPNYVFAPVWSTLYILIGITGWRVFVYRPNKGLAILWVLQMCLNFLWSPAFFGAQMLAAALVICLAMLTIVALFIVMASKSDKPSAIMFYPYLIWLAMASYLNAGVLFLN